MRGKALGRRQCRTAAIRTGNQALLNPGSSEEDSGSPPPLGWEWEELLLDLKGPAALG